MKCVHCGNEIPENAKFCGSCGMSQPQEYYQPPQPDNQSFQNQYYNPQAQYQGPQTQPNPQMQYQPMQQQYQPVQPQKQESKSVATCALVFAFLMPIVGLILGIIGTVKYKDEKLKKQSIIAIPVSVVVWVINIVAVAVIYSL